MDRIKLCGLTLEEMTQIVGSPGYTRDHALAISNGIYKKSARDLSAIAKVPKKVIAEVARVADIGTFEHIEMAESTDKSVKYLYRSEAGRVFETVFIPDKKRNTVCVSVQSGCRMGCTFCATGSYGFYGNLTAGEIVNQVLNIKLFANVTNVVFMGMGEPFDNIENVMKACHIMTAEWGLSLSTRNITVSTVGITPAIMHFLKHSACNLTLSLHSPFPGERKAIIPVEKKYPAEDIISIMRDIPLVKKRRLSIAYVMMKDINDKDEHLAGLKNLLSGSGIRVNLIPYHQTGRDSVRASSSERILNFKHNLVTSGISASIRKSRGIDISAACGLLASGLEENTDGVFIP